MQNRANLKKGRRNTAGPNLTILCYHAIANENPPLSDYCFLKESVFRDHMRWLQRSRMDVLPLTQAVDALFDGRLRRNSVAITFDDGYRNNIVTALPILEQFGLNATIFLTTGLTGTRSTLWPNRILIALQQTKKTALSWRGETVEWSDGTGKAKANARLQALVKHHSPANPDDAASEIETLLGTEPNPDVDPDSVFAMMDHDDIDRGVNSGVMTFGAHTLRHPILSALDDASVESEIAGSITQVEAFTQSQCETFAYPNGQETDFDSRAISVLKNSPVKYAFTTESAQNHLGAAPLGLARWTIGQATTLRKLQARFWLAKLSHLAGMS